jgi:hypothetical protein
MVEVFTPCAETIATQPNTIKHSVNMPLNNREAFKTPTPSLSCM